MALVPLIAAALAASPAQPAEAVHPVSPDPALALPGLVVLQDEEVADAKWHGAFTLGATSATGNTELTQINLGADAKRRSENDRYSFRGWWNYSEQNDVISERRAGLTGQYDYFLSERLYALAIAGVDTDELAGIDLRYYVGPGMGYQFVENEKVDFGGDLAITYFSAEYDDGRDEQYAAARVAYDLGWNIADGHRFDQIAEAFPSLEDEENFYGRLDSKYRYDLTANLFAQIQWVYDYNNQPAAGAERSDNRILLGVGWSY